MDPSVRRSVSVPTNVHRVHLKCPVAQRGMQFAVTVDGNVFKSDGELLSRTSPFSCFGWRRGPETVTDPAIEELPRIPVTLKVRSSGSMLNCEMFRLARVR